LVGHVTRRLMDAFFDLAESLNLVSLKIWTLQGLFMSVIILDRLKATV